MSKTQNDRPPMRLEPMMDRNARRSARTPRMAGVPGVLCLALIAWALGAPTDPRSAVVRQELQIVHKKLPGAETDPRRDVHVFVEVSPVQPRIAGGICFVIDVVNESSERLELADITDGHIGLYLWNTDGVPVELPDYERTSKVQRVGALPEHIKGEIKQRRPFAVMKPDFLPDDPKVKSIESIKDGKIWLEGGEHFQVQVLVTKVLSEPEKWQAEIEKRSGGKVPLDLPGPEPPQIGSIEAGTYQFAVHVALVVEGNHPWVASSDRLTVRLGPPVDEEKGP